MYFFFMHVCLISKHLVPVTEIFFHDMNRRSYVVGVVSDTRCYSWHPWFSAVLAAEWSSADAVFLSFKTFLPVRRVNIYSWLWQGVLGERGVKKNDFNRTASLVGDEDKVPSICRREGTWSNLNRLRVSAQCSLASCRRKYGPLSLCAVQYVHVCLWGSL